jgi:hypothetical protein
MRKRLLIIIILLTIQIPILNINISNKNATYAQSKSCWARISNAYTLLYKTTVNNSSFNNVYCILDKTYFVEILKEEEFHYFVNYNNLNGYVKKTDVTKVSATPVSPFPTGIKMRIRNNNCNLRTSPTVTANINNIATIIPANTTNLIYYGKIYGDEVIDFEGNTWYFVNYLGINGYIYSEYFDELTPVELNTEKINLVKNSFTIINPLSSTMCIIIIVTTLIPCALLFFFILKKPKLKVIKTHKPRLTKVKNKIRIDDDIEKLL